MQQYDFKMYDMIQFADKCISYEPFVEDLARENDTLQTKALRQPKDVSSRREAYKFYL